jgi:hypothetical protein
MSWDADKREEWRFGTESCEKLFGLGEVDFPLFNIWLFRLFL